MTNAMGVQKRPGKPNEIKKQKQKGLKEASKSRGPLEGDGSRLAKREQREPEKEYTSGTRQPSEGLTQAKGYSALLQENRFLSLKGELW